jgi:hypothetical protein
MRTAPRASIRSAVAGQLYVPRGTLRADKGSQYGVALRYLVPQHPNAEISLYHVNYHSRAPLVSGVRGGLTAAATISGNLQPAGVAALEAAGIPATAAGDPACTVVDLPAFDSLQTPANIASLAPIVGGLHRRQRCRRRTQRMPRAPRRPAVPALRSSTTRNTSSSGASAQVRDFRAA